MTCINNVSSMIGRFLLNMYEVTHHNHPNRIIQNERGVWKVFLKHGESVFLGAVPASADCHQRPSLTLTLTQRNREAECQMWGNIWQSATSSLTLVSEPPLSSTLRPPSLLHSHSPLFSFFPRSSLLLLMWRSADHTYRPPAASPPSPAILGHLLQQRTLTATSERPASPVPVRQEPGNHTHTHVHKVPFFLPHVRT